MDMENRSSYAFFRNFAGPLSFALFFVISSICITLLVPQEHKNTTLDKEITTAQAESSEIKKPVEQLAKMLDTYEQNEIKLSSSKSVTNKILENAEEKDPSLLFYRKLTTRIDVIDFYTKVCSNRNTAIAILEYSSYYDIQPSLAFSLAYSESRYKITAVNRNSNNSIDRGLFQLNSNTFPSLKEEEFFNPFVSAKQGLSFLKFCLDTAGNEIGALAMYNAGASRVKSNRTPHQTLNHIANITNYQKGLEKLFEEEFETTISKKQNLLLTMAEKKNF